MLEKTRQGQQQEKKPAKAAGESATDPAIIAAAVSVGLSWYFFFVRGDRQRGLFVGLWPPTILAFASYFNQTKMSRMLKSTSRGATGSVVESIDQMMRSR